MSITTTGQLGPMILQSLAPAMLYVPTPSMNYILVCDKVCNEALYKSDLIDLEAYSISHGDKAQAAFACSVTDLGGWTSIIDEAKVGSIQRKGLSTAEMTVPSEMRVTNRSMPANGGTTCRFMRPRALVPPTVQLGNSK